MRGGGSTVLQFLVVGAGGFCGAVARVAVAGAVQRWAPASQFPYGTLAVNVVGCLAIGVVAGVAEVHGLLGPRARLFLVLGFLGSFTTFSTFGHETMMLALEARPLAAAANVALQVVAGLAACWLGYALVRAF
jgi:CrcB protein